MILADLLPALKELPHRDKLRAIQFLMSEIAKEEDVSPNAEATYPSWSPDTSGQAAATTLAAALPELDGIALQTSELTEKRAADTRMPQAAFAGDGGGSALRAHDQYTSAEASFRQGWQEAQSGQVHPLAELWDGIHAE